MHSVSQAVIDVLVKVTRVVDDSKARHAFVIAKELKGIFRIGDNPLSSDFPYLEEPDAIKLMREIMNGVRKVFAKRKDLFDEFLAYSSKITEFYNEIMSWINSFINNPNDVSLLDKILSQNCRMSLTLFMFQYELHHLCAKHWKSAIALFSESCFKNTSDNDLTWGFESACELLSALLAVQRVAIEVLRRAMSKGGLQETRDRLFEGHHQMAQSIETWSLYTQEQIEKELTDRHEDVDSCISRFYKVTDEYWEKSVGQIRKLPINLHESPPIAVSHNRELYWISSKEDKLVKFVEDTCSEADTNVTLTPIVQLVSHKGKLYCIAEYGNLYELDPESGHTTLLIENTLFKLCTSMVSLGDYLYITLNTYLYNLYRIDPIEKSYTCISSGWCGARLASFEGGPLLLYARYGHTLSDSIYTIDTTSSPEITYNVESSWWGKSRVPNLVAHGNLLYTSDKGDLSVINTSHFGLLRGITRSHKALPSTEFTPLVSHGFSIVCQHFNDWRFHPHSERKCFLALVRPLWVDPPENWFEEWLTNGIA